MGTLKPTGFCTSLSAVTKDVKKSQSHFYVFLKIPPILLYCPSSVLGCQGFLPPDYMRSWIKYILCFIYFVHFSKIYIVLIVCIYTCFFFFFMAHPHPSITCFRKVQSFEVIHTLSHCWSQAKIVVFTGNFKPQIFLFC